MSVQITLTMTQGSLQGRHFVFRDRTLCTIGRGRECFLHLSDEADRGVSRRHSLLDIRPPEVRIRDLGSLNGTYVNGENIGQREKGQSAEEAVLKEFPFHDLWDGDEVRIGTTCFRIGIAVVPTCLLCAHTIPVEKQESLRWAHGLFLCQACRAKAEQYQDQIVLEEVLAR